MSAVALHAIEARPIGADRRGDEVLGQLPHLDEAQGPGSRLGVVGRADRLRSDEGRRRPHPRVMQLHHGEAAFRLDAGGQPGQPVQMLVGEDPQLAGETLSPRLNM